MSETSEGEQSVRREAAVPALSARVSSDLIKGTLPSMMTSDLEALRNHPGYDLMHSVGASVEIFGMSEMASGKPEGALHYIAGKFVSRVAETRAKKKEKKGKTSKRIDEADFVDTPTTELTSKIAASAVKALLPTYISGGSVEGRGYQTMRDVGRIAETVSFGALFGGNTEVAGAAYVTGRALSLFAEAADKHGKAVYEKAKDVVLMGKTAAEHVVEAKVDAKRAVDFAMMGKPAAQHLEEAKADAQRAKETSSNMISWIKNKLRKEHKNNVSA